MEKWDLFERRILQSRSVEFLVWSTLCFVDADQGIVGNRKHSHQIEWSLRLKLVSITVEVAGKEMKQLSSGHACLRPV